MFQQEIESSSLITSPELERYDADDTEYPTRMIFLLSPAVE
jgi:hypothetical protein